MNSSKNLAAIAALAISAGLAGSGCMAQGADDATTDGQDQVAAPSQTAEQTGTASEKCGGLWGGGWGGGWGGFGGCGGWGGGWW